MPKDATKNIDRYKIRGGQLNEFEFQRQQEEFAEASKPEPESLIPGTPPEQRDGAQRFLGKLIKKAGKAAKKASPVSGTAKAKATVRATAKKSTKATAKQSAKTTKAAEASKATKSRPRGATAKKLAARKAAKK